MRSPLTNMAPRLIGAVGFLSFVSWVGVAVTAVLVVSVPSANVTIPVGSPFLGSVHVIGGLSALGPHPARQRLAQAWRKR